jgi:uncharacterized protein (DUF1501 family)
MNILSRRTFLGRSLQAALGAAASAHLSIPAFLQRALAAGAIPDGTKKLLFIFLRGGNDGVNTVIPWGDDAYNNTTRPTLYIPFPDPLMSVSGRAPDDPDPNRTIDLGNHFAGLHPGLIDLVPVFNARQLAVIHRVGYPRQSRSHFDSQRYWENGAPNSLSGEGIFYRALVDTGIYKGRSFPGVSVQSTSPVLLRGDIAMPSLANPSRYDILGVASNATDKRKLLTAIDGEYRIPYPEKDNRGLLFPTGKTLKDSIESLKSVGVDNNEFYDVDGTTHLFPIKDTANQRGVSSGSFGFFNSLKVAAQILAHTDAVITGTQLSGFDTHDNQGGLTGGHANLMKTIGWSIYALRQYFLSVNPALWENTAVVTLSEFGRTSKENGNRGTDHGEASPMFVAGGKINGGVYQCGNDSWTVGLNGTLFKIGGRYLGRSVDYRSVLGEIIRDHLGATPEQLNRIIPGYALAGESLLSGGTSSRDGTKIVGEVGIV